MFSPPHRGIGYRSKEDMAKDATKRRRIHSPTDSHIQTFSLLLQPSHERFLFATTSKVDLKLRIQML